MLSRAAKVRRFLAKTLLAALAGMVVLAPGALAQESARKVKSQVKPAYPELARQMHIAGKVKVEIVITPAGSVKSTKVLGGHPLLASAAEDAAKKWKFEPAATETTETLVFEFNPSQ